MINYKIDGIDIYLEDIGEGKGKIIVTSPYNTDHNYSYYWGAMGKSLEDFICGLTDDYFCGCLMGHRSMYSIDIPKTFKAIRNHIKNEVFCGYYNQMEFQKDVRRCLREFQVECEGVDSPEGYFYYNFDSSFLNQIDYTLITTKSIYGVESEREFREFFTEHHYFIEKSINDEFKRLSKILDKLKSKIKQKQFIEV